MKECVWCKNFFDKSKLTEIYTDIFECKKCEAEWDKELSKHHEQEAGV